MRQGVRVLALLAVFVSSCGAEVAGPGIPGCGTGPSDGVAAATVLQLQAVPGASWGPCVSELRVGWDYVPQFAESGRATFWLDSDRVGSRFLEVTLTPTCDTAGAEAQGSPEFGIDRFVRVVEEAVDITIPIVPVAERHVEAAEGLAQRLNGTRVRGQRILPSVDRSTGSPVDRIDRALRISGIALVLDDAQVASDTVELRRVGHGPRLEISFDDALEEIEEDIGPPVYRAEWFHVFEGGCITYDFDARGPGSESLALEVRTALGFYPLGVLRDAARNAGLDI